MKRGRKVRPVYDRVMSMTNIPKNDKGKPDNKACWEFQGAKNNAGYGMIRKENEKKAMQLAHRAIGISIGLDENQEIQHTCLNKLCVNPKHLVNGNAQTRNDRMYKAGIYRPHQDPNWRYKTCEHCGGTTTGRHFASKHSNCHNISLHK